MSLRASYDPQVDILYLAEEGIAPETVEVYPCVSLEINPTGALIGVEISCAVERLLGSSIVEPMLNGGEFYKVTLKGSLADLDAQLRPADGSEHLDYIEAWPNLLEKDPEAVKTLETIRRGIGALLKQVKDETAVS